MRCRVVIHIDGVTVGDVNNILDVLSSNQCHLDERRLTVNYHRELDRDTDIAERFRQYNWVRNIARVIPESRRFGIAVTFQYIDARSKVVARGYWASLNATTPAKFAYAND